MNTGLRKVVVVYMLVLIVLGGLWIGGCGKGGEGAGKVTITIGEINDLTGPASPAVAPMHKGLVDLVRYYNDEGLIPGVKLKLVTYDNHMDPARTLPGYDWVRGQGADLAITVLPQDGDVLKPFADRDRFPIFSMSSTEVMYEPPGWVFCLVSPGDQMMVTLLKWVSETKWDYSQGIPKVGFVSWSESTAIALEKATKEYCQAHPDKFNYIGCFMAPVGSITWGAAVQRLKHCDYIGVCGPPTPGFLRDYRAEGYRATILDPSTLLTQEGFNVDMIGWDGLDGMLTAGASQTWSGTSPIVDLAREVLERYRSGEADKIIYSGTGYEDAVASGLAILAILQNAIEAVGSDEKLSSQAIYNAAVEYKTGGALWQGSPQWSYSETKRCLLDEVRIYEWSAAKKDVVMIQDWIPVVSEW